MDILTHGDMAGLIVKVEVEIGAGIFIGEVDSRALATAQTSAHAWLIRRNPSGSLEKTEFSSWEIPRSHWHSS